MKTCKICQQSKFYEEFSSSKTTKDGYHSYCRACHRARNKANHIKNREAVLIRQKNNYLANHEKSKQDRRAHYQNNKGMYLANYYKRQDRISLATPEWLSPEMLKLTQDIYKQRLEKSKAEGIEYHVDHIVPINGKNVCGLNVPWNLQIITAEENLRKSNKYE